ncbi:MAG: twin-arginine translocase TatA/TatE family subunit [Veillonella sp.]|nr:twin-arginine translocase TatA/TatE family subunit [Veillonella sp.]
MGSIGTPELIVILVIALVIFGPGKLPAVDETKEAVKSATTIDVTAGAKNDEKHKEAND